MKNSVTKKGSSTRIFTPKGQLTIYQDSFGFTIAKGNITVKSIDHLNELQKLASQWKLSETDACNKIVNEYLAGLVANKEFNGFDFDKELQDKCK